jgi:hypothetical protein
VPGLPELPPGPQAASARASTAVSVINNFFKGSCLRT